MAWIISARGVRRLAPQGIDISPQVGPEDLEKGEHTPKTHTDSFPEATGASRHGRAVHPPKGVWCPEAVKEFRPERCGMAPEESTHEKETR